MRSRVGCCPHSQGPKWRVLEPFLLQVLPFPAGVPTSSGLRFVFVGGFLSFSLQNGFVPALRGHVCYGLDRNAQCTQISSAVKNAES